MFSIMTKCYAEKIHRKYRASILAQSYEKVDKSIRFMHHMDCESKCKELERLNMQSSYWSKFVQRRVSRRRALTATTLTAGAAAFLAACGGDDDSASPTATSASTGSTGATGATGTTGSDRRHRRHGCHRRYWCNREHGCDRRTLCCPTSSTRRSKAKRGGTMKWTQASEPLHFDGQAQGQAQLNIYNGMVYESLVRNKPGIGKPSTLTEVSAQPGRVLGGQPGQADDYLQAAPGRQVAEHRAGQRPRLHRRGRDARASIATSTRRPRTTRRRTSTRSTRARRSSPSRRRTTRPSSTR